MEYPKKIRVEIDLEERQEAIIIVHDEEENNELLEELAGLLPYVKEFETVEGETVDSWNIRNIIEEEIDHDEQK